jgi:CheY-like chemotaxis protein
VSHDSPQWILVIDDDDELRGTIVEVLVDTGLEVRQAQNGAVALKRLREAAVLPAVILLDLMMPEMNGWEFRTAQLADPQLAAIPVVVMTASRDLKGVQADDVLRKPATLNDLIKAVSRFVAPRPAGVTEDRARDG